MNALQSHFELLMQEVNIDPAFKRLVVGMTEERRQEIRDECRQDEINDERYQRNHPGDEE